MTTSIPTRLDTPIAVAERFGDDRVEVRMKPGATLTIAGIAAFIEARQQLAAGVPMRAMIVMPEDEVDFDMSMITTDHYESRPMADFSKAIAWVTRNDHNDRFCRLYFAYFPSPVPCGIFLEEKEALAWLETMR
ncbi:MAG: hypothetical protein IPI81_05115 [Flavobacteriales bacterium]|nr:hypothetical protein [Flavobacteriales bacterium]MCC6939804.1 hypothetical protein [Flavobacteriales bacterium]